MIVKTILTITIILVIFPPKTHAYLDPGTGSYIIQILFGALVGGLFILKTYWLKIMAIIQSLVKRFKSSQKPNDSTK